MEKESAMGRAPNKPPPGGFGFGKASPYAAAGAGAGPNQAAALEDHNTTHRRGEYIPSSSPFHVFNSAATEEMVAFTTAQWKELERQAMIYKYMISSLPVPPNLLYASPVSSAVGYTKVGAALEPGRCKRTDGKKWRCSRDVAPHQKYCERHLNRGRPRSRKPVELNNKINDDKQKKPRLQQTKQVDPSKDEPRFLFSPKSDFRGTNREMEQKWLESDMGFANSIYGSNSASDSHQDMNHVLAYSDFPTLDIDAWSNNNMVNLGPTLPMMGYESFSPSLSLDDGGMGNAQAYDGGVGFYVEESSWSSSSVCWGAFGGPLAEALCANPPISPRDSFGVSSPCGVIQRFSNSGESSVCTSPSEIGFQRIK